jgi:hypothetical protein
VTARALVALATADFRERVRRPAFGMTLLATIAVGYLAVPAAGASYALVQVGEYRGVYDSGYVGTVLAVTTAVWLAFAGFFVVRNAVGRDAATGVGQILAATPLRAGTYLFGKFLSNFLVLAAMTAVVGVMALAMQLVRGEVFAIDPVGLWLPLLLIPIPLMAVVAGAALFFETVPGLRGGFGILLWGFGSFVLYVATQVLLRVAPSAAFDPFGLVAVSRAMRADVLAQHPAATDPVIIVGLVTREEQPARFTWEAGLGVDAGLVGQRSGLLLLAVLLAVLPALWFNRFDPAARGPGGGIGQIEDGIRRLRALLDPGRRSAARATAAVTGGPTSPAPGTAGTAPAAVVGTAVGTAVRPATGRLTPAARALPLGRLVAGEFRVLLGGVPLWWLLGALAVAVVAAIAPTSAVANPLLPLAWLWPVLIWSRLGTQRFTHQVDPLIVSAPAARRRLLAEWLAAALLTAAVGLLPLVRFAAAGEYASVTRWLAAVAFIPTLALALGTLSRGPRLFQAVYVVIWLGAVTGERALDFLGAVREGDQPVGPAPLAVLALTAVLAVVIVVVHQVRHSRR